MHAHGAQTKYEEQGKALHEMGEFMAKNAVLLNEYEQQQRQAKEQVWEDDSQATECKGCTKAFNVSRRFVPYSSLASVVSESHRVARHRRKHHCRNCGGVFCNDCSNRKMPLPSSPKPVRVCEACVRLLLAQLGAE